MKTDYKQGEEVLILLPTGQPSSPYAWVTGDVLSSPDSRINIYAQGCQWWDVTPCALLPADATEPLKQQRLDDVSNEFPIQLAKGPVIGHL